jgi:hypothetical protein
MCMMEVLPDIIPYCLPRRLLVSPMTHFNNPAVVEQDLCADFIARVP